MPDTRQCRQQQDRGQCDAVVETALNIYSLTNTHRHNFRGDDGLAVSTFLTSVLLPTTTTLAEDSGALVTRPLGWLRRGFRPLRTRGAGD